MSVDLQPRSTTRRRVAVTATAVITALGALGAASPALASAPAAAATSSTPTASRPLSPELRALLLTRAAQAAHRTTGPLAAGFRPVPGSTVSTDLPTRIEIGAPSVQLPFHTSVSGSTAGYTDPVGIVGLVVNGQFPTGLVLRLAPGQRSFAGSLRLPESAFIDLGTGFWETGITPDAAEDDTPAQLTDVPVTVKLRSLLGQKVTRAGSTVEVFASTKTYAGSDQYRPATGRVVYVQRSTSSGWTTLRTLTADQAGHVDTRVTLPYRVAIRVTTRDTATTFGAVTAAAVL